MSNIDRCESAGRRHHDYSANPAACEATKEDQAAASDAAQREAERAAEAKRNAYFASDEDVGGRSARASSDASVVPVQTNDDPALRDYLRTKAIDRPLQDDPLGNAIVGAVAGGVGAGVRAAASEAAAGAAGRSVLGHMAEETGKQLAKGAAKEGVKDAATHAAREHGIRSGRIALAPEPHAPPAATQTDAAGRSSPRAASEVAPEPNASTTEDVTGRDRVPFAPGKAPVRVPEAPLAVVIRG